LKQGNLKESEDIGQETSALHHAAE